MTRALIRRFRPRATSQRTASPSAIRARRRNAFNTLSRSVLVAAAVVIVAGFLILLLGPLAQWATVNADHLQGKDKADAVNATRQILLAATGGTAVLVGLGYTARNYYLSKRGQLTDRYTKAMTQLASDKITERLGGIYALERLMRESEADHTTIVAVLAAFIRENAPAGPLRSPDDADSGSLADPSTPAPRPDPKPATDIQAALTVLARRPHRPEPDSIDLSNTDLRGSDLRWARLEGAQLGQTWFQYANLSSANLKRTFLRKAKLQHTWLVFAQLQEADLINAQLDQANLGGAQLQKADLRMAQLRHAHLLRAELSSVRLSGACLEGANLTDAKLHNAHLGGARISGRVHMESIGYHSNEKERDEDLDGAQLQGANLAGTQLYGAWLATSPLPGRPGSVRGLTAAQLAEADLDDTTKLPDDLRTALADERERQRRAGNAVPDPTD